MKPTSDNELFAALEELRPEPRPAFAAELDARAAAGFPRRSPTRGLSPALDRLRSLKPRQVLLPAGALALSAIFFAAVVLSQKSGTVSLNSAVESSGGSGSGTLSEIKPFSASGDSASAGAGAQLEPGAPSAAAAEGRNFDGSGGYVRGSKRAIERSAEITLGTEPENVGRASSEVFRVVHANRGIVLNSQTSEGSHAEASFELMIPSGKLGDAMAGFSEIAEVRSRHEATTDITAPTVGAAEHLEDSRARIDSLLGQLAGAETEGEREAVERELGEERSRAAALRASLDDLERRASLSRVSLRIVGGEGGSAGAGEGGSWGVGDALHDSGRILATAAAVALVALAVLGPLALIALLVWLARRTYLRRARQTALG